MTTLSAPAAEDARRFVRTLDRAESLQAGIMSPTAGSRPVKLCSLREAETFLSPVPDPRTAGYNMKNKVNYVEPRTLAVWVRNVVGDEELAGRMDEVVAGELPYAAIVLEMKRLIADRTAQYATAMEEAKEESCVGGLK